MSMSVAEENVIVPVKPYSMQKQDEVIRIFLESMAHASDRLWETVQFFLGKPYCLEPLGEGSDGRYSQEPLYRTEAFDCVTYVDTVLALYHASDLDAFRQNMQRIRYRNGPPAYTMRTDWFIDLEWIPVVQRAGWIRDITSVIQDRRGQPMTVLAETVIDKPNWYRVRPLKMLHRLSPVPEGAAAEALLQELRAESIRFLPERSTVTYLPLGRLFDAKGRPDIFVFDQIPSGTLVFIVRPDWPIRDHFRGFPEGYGTNLNISHLGIVIRSGGQLLFYNASSLHGKVMGELLADYLGKCLESPTIKGIHLEQIVEGV